MTLKVLAQERTPGKKGCTGHYLAGGFTLCALQQVVVNKTKNGIFWAFVCGMTSEESYWKTALCNGGPSSSEVVWIRLRQYDPPKKKHI